MDLQTVAMDLQEAFVLTFGVLIFWGLVLYLVATLVCVILLPFLQIEQ